jgi:mannose-6-phosphate isomerase-like protein (cupin superfamily)
MPDGSVYEVRSPAAASDGAFVEMDFILPSHCVPPPPHVHREQVEEYEVLEGALDVVIDGAWTTLGPGDRARVPVGAVHTFANRSGATVRVRNWHRPAKRFEAFIAQTSGTLAAHGVTRRRDPRVFLLLSQVMLEYDETLAPARRREALPMRAMAAVARRFL